MTENKSASKKKFVFSKKSKTSKPPQPESLQTAKQIDTKDNVATDLHFEIIAEEIFPGGLPSLCRHLGLTDTKVQQIQYDNRHLGFKEQTIAILQLWRKQSGRNATVQVLLQACDGNVDVSTANKIKQRLRAEGEDMDNSQSGSHIMISYQWDVQRQALALQSQLTKAGYSVWLDVDKMGGHLLGSMASAVENSAVIIICVSQKYKESNNCQAEASYAFQLKKPIIPVIMQEGYTPDGWLGIMISMRLYYRMYNDEVMKKDLPALINDLGNRGRSIQPTIFPNKAKSEASKCHSFDLSDRRKALIYLCDLQKQALPPADVWVTVFLDPDLKVFNDEISRLLFTSGGDVLRKQIHALFPTSKTPLKVGTVLVTTPGDLPCNQVFHIVFKENIVSSWYKSELTSAFSECIDLAQNLGARSIAFSLFTCQQMFEYGSVVDTMVEAAVGHPGSIDDILFVSHRTGVVTHVSTVLHDFLVKKENKLLHIGSYTMKNGPSLQILYGDILYSTTDAMIISTDSALRKQGLCGHIYRNGGAAFRNEYNSLASKTIKPGCAFTLSGDGLPCNHVIVAVVPYHHMQDRGKLLQKALLSSLECVEILQAKTVSLPAIGCNYAGFQEKVHCQFLLEALVKYFQLNPSSCIQNVSFVEFSKTPSEALKDAVENSADFTVAIGDISQHGEEGVEKTETPAEILAQGPAALEAYLEASQDGTKSVYRTRLMLVGQERVGKTSLMKNLSGQSFNTEESITDGVDVSTLCEVQLNSMDAWKLQESAKTDLASHVQSQYVDTLCTLMAERLTTLGEKKGDKEVQYQQRNIEDIKEKEDEGIDESSHVKQLDTTGEERRDDTDAKELSHGDEDKDVMESTSQPIDNTKAGAEDQEADLRTRLAVVPDAILEKLLQQLRENKSEDEQDGSAKDGNIQEFKIWDFAGQDVYYTTHQVFLSNRAIYIVVFDLCLDLNKPVKVQVLHDDKVDSRFHDFTGLGFLDFWMQSIYAYATSNQQAPSEDRPQLSPPIFIVGTHRDSYDISHDPEERKRLVDEKFQSITDMIAGKPYEQHVVSKYYAIENSSNDQTDSQLSQLRQHITSVSSQELYMGEKIPVRWLTFEKSVAEAINKDQHYMNLTQVKDLTRDLSIISETELFTMLHFYHDLGTIIYFGGENNSNTYLQDMVILDPQWLIDIFKRIITVMPHQEQWATMKNKWRRLKEEAILEDHLIDHMWHDLLPQKPALLALMEMFDLLCPRLDVNKDTDVETYYVPACLQPCSEERAHQEAAASGNPVIFYVDFQGFLPDGLFHRLLVHTARWSQQQSGEEPQLYFRYGNFCLDDDHNFQLEMQATNPMCIKVTVSKTLVLSVDGAGDNSNVETQPGPVACCMVQTFLAHALKELTYTWIHGIKYEFSVACPCNDLQQSPQPDITRCFHLLQLEECLKKTKIKCKEKKMWVQTEVFKKWFNDGVMEKDDVDNSEKEYITLSDVKLLELAGEVGAHWKKLGLYLGLKACHLASLNCDQSVTEDKAFYMLIQWREGLSKMADGRGLLCKALKKCDLVSLAEGITTEKECNF